MSTSPPSGLVLVPPPPEGGSLYDAVERALGGDTAPLAELPAMTNLALQDEYLARQLVALHQQWELRPRPGAGLLGRLRSRLAWWLLGPEIAQANAFHATSVRLIDSLLVHLDAERAGRRRIEESLAYRREP